MGLALKKLLKEPNQRFCQEYEISGQITSSSTDAEGLNALHASDMVLDFSSLQGTRRLCSLLESCSFSNAPPAILIATTGLSSEIYEQAQKVTKKQNLKTLLAANTSLGIAVLYHTLTRWMKVLGEQEFDIELIEYHHNKKRDLPSGTAALLLEPILQHPKHHKAELRSGDGLRSPGSVGVHGVRAGGIFGRHELHFVSDHEHLTLSHEALSRTVFARGALLLIETLLKKQPGFYHYQKLEFSDFER